MHLLEGGLRGWAVGSFLATRDSRHAGVVLRVHEWGVVVLWDDDTIGHLVWDIEQPNHIDTVKLLSLYGNRTLRDFYSTPYADLWKAVHQHVYIDSYPKTAPSVLSTGAYLHALPPLDNAR
jgi:hypothetical protein